MTGNSNDHCNHYFFISPASTGYHCSFSCFRVLFSIALVFTMIYSIEQDIADDIPHPPSKSNESLQTLLSMSWPVTGEYLVTLILLLLFNQESGWSKVEIELRHSGFAKPKFVDKIKLDMMWNCYFTQSKKLI